MRRLRLVPSLVGAAADMGSASPASRALGAVLRSWGPLPQQHDQSKELAAAVADSLPVFAALVNFKATAALLNSCPGRSEPVKHLGESVAPPSGVGSGLLGSCVGGLDGVDTINGGDDCSADVALAVPCGLLGCKPSYIHCLRDRFGGALELGVLQG